MSSAVDRKGMAVFGLIAFVMLIVSLTAFQMTGNMGIEERFTNALGISRGEGDEDTDEEGNGLSGFFIEGNVVLYLLFLILLLMICYMQYRRPAQKQEKDETEIHSGRIHR